jgi:hypothetical protein
LAPQIPKSRNAARLFRSIVFNFRHPGSQCDRLGGAIISTAMRGMRTSSCLSDYRALKRVLRIWDRGCTNEGGRGMVGGARGILHIRKRAYIGTARRGLGRRNVTSQLTFTLDGKTEHNIRSYRKSPSRSELRPHASFVT